MLAPASAKANANHLRGDRPENNPNQNSAQSAEIESCFIHTVQITNSEIPDANFQGAHIEALNFFDKPRMRNKAILDLQKDMLTLTNTW